MSLEESWRLLADPAAGHVLDNFRFAAKPGSGQYQGTTWQDEWLYKWIEAAACVWRQNRDPALLKRMDEAIALIAAAQQPDGYLSTMPLAKQLQRFQSAQDHEVYNMGHLLTACLESPDLPEGVKNVADIHIPSDAKFTPVRGMSGSKEPMAGTLMSLEGSLLQQSEQRWDTLYQPLGQPTLRPAQLRLIPYFAWCNRGPCAMSVWMPVVLRHP